MARRHDDHALVREYLGADEVVGDVRGRRQPDITSAATHEPGHGVGRVGSGHADDHVGVTAAELADEFGQGGLEPEHGGHPHVAAEQALDGVDAAAGDVGFVQGSPSGVDERLAGIGERHALGKPMEQVDAEFSFETQQGVGDRRARLVQDLGPPSDASLLGDGDHDAQRTEIHAPEASGRSESDSARGLVALPSVAKEVARR